MAIVNNLIGFGLRQVLGESSGLVLEVVEKRFLDHSQALPRALARANDRTWQTLGIALAGDGFLDQVKVFFASTDDKNIREQVQLFLQDNSLGLQSSPVDFRKACLAEFKKARHAGLLTAQGMSAQEIGRQTASFQRYADLKGLVDSAEQVVAQIAEDLVAECPNLGKLLKQKSGGGPPFLVAAFAFFFRREVENNEDLAHGLFFDGLRQLSAVQARAFSEVQQALTTLGDKFDQVFEQLGHIETVVVETQGAVLDMQTELQRLGDRHLAHSEEVRQLMQEVLRRVGQVGMQSGEVKPNHSLSIRGEDERLAVKQLLARYRQLPPEEQGQLLALQNGLGKLQVGIGDFAGATETFQKVAQAGTSSAVQAEAQHNAYRAALEQKKWDEALLAMQLAATLEPQRFAPFPLQRYQPKRILGAGGFGTAFLCHDRNFDEDVVVKTLHSADLERSMAEVFQEARLLRKVNHPAIIGVHECEFANPAKQGRPFIVMDYFPGSSLQAYIDQHGSLSPENLLVVARQIAAGMKAAHQQNILHRDLKPDNVLVHQENGVWQVKIIDFGLALRRSTIETSMAARPSGQTILGDSVAGTLRYAPPEQLGEMPGVKPGPYSDVYAFGKLCCYALFKTTEPKSRHWSTIPKNLAEMLEKCLEQELEHRHGSFEPVLKVLEASPSAELFPAPVSFKRNEREIPKPPPLPKTLEPYPRAVEYARPQEARGKPVVEAQLLPNVEITRRGTARIENCDVSSVLTYLAQTFTEYGVHNLWSDVENLSVSGTLEMNMLSFGQNVVGKVTKVPGGVAVVITSKPLSHFYDWGRGKKEAEELIRNLYLKITHRLPDHMPGRNNTASIPVGWIILACFPCLNWIFWIYAGIKVKSPVYHVFAALYSIPFLLSAMVGEASDQGDFFAGVVCIATCWWTAGIFHFLKAKDNLEERISQASRG